MKKNSTNGRSSFDLTVNKVPYHVDILPFSFNEEKRFEISINGDDGHIFAWDPDIVGLRALDESASTLPDDLEKAISDKLVKTVIE